MKPQPRAGLFPTQCCPPASCDCSSGAHSLPSLRCFHPRGCLCGSKASRIVTSGACEQKGLCPVSLSPLEATDLTLLYSVGHSQPITQVPTMTTPHDFLPQCGEGWMPTCHAPSWETLKEKHFGLGLVRCWYTWKSRMRSPVNTLLKNPTTKPESNNQFKIRFLCTLNVQGGEGGGQQREIKV